MKKTKSGSICCMAVILCFTLILLSGCGVLLFNSPAGNAPQTDPSDTTGPLSPGNDFESVTHNYSSEILQFRRDLSGEGYKGAAVKIVTTKKNTILPEESAGVAISEELNRRNRYVEEMLQVTITSARTNPGTLGDEIRAAVRSDSYFSDLILFPQSYISDFGASGLLMNLRSLPGLKPEAGYFNATGTSAGTGGDMVYALTGYAGLQPDALSGIYFNRSLMEKLDLDSPYALVDSGDWTMDRYLEYTAALSGLDGEYYSYAAQNTSVYLPDLLFFSGGQRLVESKPGAFPRIAFTSEDTLDLFTKIVAIVYDENAYGNALEGISAFDSGNTLFLIDRLSAMKTIANSKTDWGLLPLPKYSADQEGYPTLAYYEDALFFGALPTVTNVQKASDVLMALNITSYGMAVDAHVTNASFLYLRDNDSIRMLDVILRNAVYDFSYTFAGANNAIPSATFSAVRNVTGGISDMQRYQDMWGAGFQNAMYNLFTVN